MPIHPDFPTSPYEIIDPDYRWLPDGQRKLENVDGKLIAPLVYKLRRKVKDWRDSKYEGASDTSKVLLNYWFIEDHYDTDEYGNLRNFKYYFAQREAVETVIYLYEIAKVRNKYDLLAFSSNEELTERMFHEIWLRFVIKMATGSGKTKVLSLILAWSYFHKLYEKNSTLSRNFLVITPNIIVLDRIRADFDGLKIFNYDPIIPDDGYNGKNWRSDFNIKLHIQDNVNITNKVGNIFLTNIHRVNDIDNKDPSFDDENRMDYFLGEKASKSTTDSKVDLGEIIRDIDELVILNDEAHHIHDRSLKWFKNIEDIHNHLLQKGKELSLQVDFTATPKTEQGTIFVQTVVDYPLVEAIYQNIVKGPVLPDKGSLNKLRERESTEYSEKYKDYIHLGYREWEKVYSEHLKVGKKAILFIMTDDTTNCDDVANYLEQNYPELRNRVLVIHTKDNGQIEEKDKGKSKEELDRLRKAANSIDDPSNPYKAIVSVLVLKEGWDVRNVTTIVGLRPFKSKSKILPEQTLGRGLRKMYGSTIVEKVSVIGTRKFIEFIESIKREGVEIEYKPMDPSSSGTAPLVIEVDFDNVKKDIDKLDIAIPKLTPRIYMDFSNLKSLDVSKFDNPVFKIESYNKKPIVIRFNYLTTGEKSHETSFDEQNPIEFRSVLNFFTETIIDSLRLVNAYDVLYGKLKEFITTNLFENQVDLDDEVFLYNLSREEVKKTVIETFKKEINKLLAVDRGSADIDGYIHLKNTNPFMVRDQPKIIPTKSVFNRIIGDSHLELEFADFLDGCDDIISFAKNYFAVHFNLDYQRHDGSISNYYPDFIVKKTEDEYYIIETKGLVDLNVPPKMERLKQWCNDVNAIIPDIKFDFVYVDEESFHTYKPRSFQELLRTFTEYKD